MANSDKNLIFLAILQEKSPGTKIYLEPWLQHTQKGFKKLFIVVKWQHNSLRKSI